MINKPTTEQILEWAKEAGAAQFVFSDNTKADHMFLVGKDFFEKFAMLAYNNGAHK